MCIAFVGYWPKEASPATCGVGVGGGRFLGGAVPGAAQTALLILGVRICHDI